MLDYNPWLLIDVTYICIETIGRGIIKYIKVYIIYRRRFNIFIYRAKFLMFCL